MLNPSENLRKKRMDLSPYLFTFLRDSNSKGTLHEILTTGKLISNKNDFICFTEAPITCYLSELEYFDTWKSNGFHAMFSKYGIGICRDWLIKNYGARPVIYGDETEKKLLHESIQWRYEYFDIQNHDYSWQREWRIHQKELNLRDIPKDHIIIIVPTDDEINYFASGYDYAIDFTEGEPGELRDPCVYEESTEKREWKCYAISQIQYFSNDFDLSGQTINQTIGEKLF